MLSSGSCVVAVKNPLDRFRRWYRKREALNAWSDFQDLKERKLEVELLSLQKKALRKQISDFQEEKAEMKKILERESKNNYVV